MTINNNQQQPLVSVLMSCYNAEEYVDEAIASILNQTYQNIEFIIVNDGSTDTTLQRIEAFDDQRIKIINRENKGLVYSLNEGLKSCQGKYIARMDADDISLLTRLEKQISFLEKNEDVAACGGAIEEFDETGTMKIRKKPTSHTDLLFYSLKTSPLAHPAATIRASILKTYSITYDSNYRYGQDVKLWSEIIKVSKLANLEDIVLKYRRSENQVSKARRKEQKQLAQKAREEVYTYIKNNYASFPYLAQNNLKHYFNYMIKYDHSISLGKKLINIFASKLTFINKLSLSIYCLVKSTTSGN